MKTNKTSIFYVDDQEGYRIRFKDRHRDKFEITDFEEPAKLLEALKETRQLPDLVLLDLYYPPKDCTKEAQQEKVRHARAQLNEFNKSIAALKKAVDDAWEPEGLFWLGEIRKKFPRQKLPVLVYTQRGLLLLEDKQLSEIEDNGADWLLKDPLQKEKEGAVPLLRTTETTEARRIAKVIDIHRASRSQTIQKIIIAIMSIVLGAFLGALATSFLDRFLFS